MMTDIKKSVMFLASPRAVFYTLIWLMVLLFVGTVAQKYIGLYAAQNLFFSSFVVWFGIVPLPGGLLTLGFLALCMLVKLLLASRWSFRNSGVIVTHIGSLLLLLGGLVTYLHAQEGNMIIYEGQRSNWLNNYHEREFIIEERGSKKIIASFNYNEINAGAALPVPKLSVRIEIIKACKNCDIFLRKDASDEFKGMAAKMDIASIPDEKEVEQNRGAVQFRVIGAGEEQDGIYFSADFIDASPKIEINGLVYNIALRHKRTHLPFEIELVDFERILHAGTSKPQSYKSEVILHDENGGQWRSIIQMNEPLRYRGYTFYQSSFVENKDGDATVLAVVKNAGRMFPYIASIIMCIGLLMHVFIRLPKLIRKSMVVKSVIIIGAALLSFTAPAQAKDFSKLSLIPILDQGRVKPLDSFARTYLEIIYGRDKLPSMSAIEWLAEVIFDPDMAYKREIFNIANPKIVDALGLERRKTHRYSYAETTIAFYSNTKTWQSLISMPANKMSEPQRQLLEVFTKTQLFGELSRSLSLLFPEFEIFNAELADILGVEKGAFVSFSKIRNQREFINKIASGINEENAKLIGLAYHMKELSGDKSSDVLKIIPPQWDNKEKLWFSPWGISAHGQGSPDSAKFLNMWGDLVIAYRAGDSVKWNDMTAQIYNFSLRMAGQKNLKKAVELEVSFNNAKPFVISLALYIAALFTAMLSLMIWPQHMRKLAFAFILAGFAFHFAGIGVRMFIMQRPPVTNMYESIIFVNLVICLFGILMEWRLKNMIGIFSAASMGVVLHFIGIRFDADGDTMGMLSAVLDTNFWLATHVVTITIGYGGCFVAGVLGHIYLIRRFFRPDDRKALSELFRNMQGVVFVALLFTVMGTILGGIWADQSWGRFWGWDPKENGALLIVLWLIFVVHGRLGAMIGELGFAALMVCTNIIVAMAWFGVNLLGVGLHSYGFTQNTTISFVLFCGFELLFAAGLYSYIRLSKNRTARAI